MELEQQLAKAARAIRDAVVLIITAGAGMGVDSGLPDFRGDHGFWNAYPMYRRLGLSFVQAANPEHFEQDPAQQPSHLDILCHFHLIQGHCAFRRVFRRASGLALPILKAWLVFS